MTSHKIIMAAIALLCAISAAARTYGIDEIPNVQAADGTKYLSNPDGIISPAANARIDSLLADARRRSTAEIVAVAVDDIDTGDIQGFGTDLINRWGVGNKDKNNGIAIILAKDSHQVAIATGDGAEVVLPDILAVRIIDDIMVPHFRDDDYDGGLTAGVEEIHRLVTDPAAAADIVADLQAAKAAETAKMIRIYVTTGIIAGIILLIWLIITVYRIDDGHKLSDYQKYQKLSKLRLPYLVVSLIFMGIPIFAFIALWILRYRLRNHPRRCAHCGAKMHKLNEAQDNQYLNDIQDLEEKLNSVDYDVWLCPQCGERDIYSFVNQGSSYRECNRCHARASRLTGARILRQPTYTSEGVGEKIYQCVHCRNTESHPYTIPRKERVSAGAVAAGALASGIGGRRGGGFGGGFGGGHASGGGASGHW